MFWLPRASSAIRVTPHYAMSPTADPASTASNEPKKKYLPPEIIEPIVEWVFAKLRMVGEFDFFSSSFVALCPYTKILATNDSGKWGPCYCSDLRKLWLPLLTVSKTWSGVVIAKIWAHLHRKELKRVHEKVNAEFSELIAKHSWACRYLYFTPHSSDADRELLSDLFGGTILSPKPQSSLEASTCWSGLRRLDISVDQSNADGLARALSAADFLKNIYFSMEDLGPESVANICRNMPACLQELDLRSRGKSEVEGRHLETTLQRCGNSIEKLRVSIHYAPSIVAEKWCFPLDRVPIALPRLRELQISCTPCGCWAHLFEAPALDMLEISMRDEDNWHHGADSVGVLLARSRNLNELYIPNWQNDVRRR